MALRGALAVTVAALSACGGSAEAAPAEWCDTTKRLLYLLDQHSTTEEFDVLVAWEESAPEEIRGSTTDAAAVLKRYPVNAHNAELIAARRDLEEYADDRCPGGSKPEP
jgi:uncharacterized protein YecA (UPF0149 family)